MSISGKHGHPNLVNVQIRYCRQDRRLVSSLLFYKPLSSGEILSDWEWNSNSACADEWTGIECRNGRVTSLDLSNLDLSGYLSGKLSKLSALQSLKLDRNHFEGILPSEWGHLRFMKYLNVSSNDIGGDETIKYPIRSSS